MSKSKLSKEISQNIVLTRRIEDLLISKNYFISEYDNRKLNLKLLCGDAVSETIGDMLYEYGPNGDIIGKNEDTIKYMITNYKGEVMTILVGYLDDDCIEDIYRCKDSKMKGINGGELLLYYVLLKYNTIISYLLDAEIILADILGVERESLITNNKVKVSKKVLLKYNTIDGNIKSIKGGVAGAIPPVKKNDSPSVIKTKQDRLIKYHIDRNAILKDVNGNIMFTYNLDNVITNLKKILRTNNALNPTMSNKSLKELKSTIRESY